MKTNLLDTLTEWRAGRQMMKHHNNKIQSDYGIYIYILICAFKTLGAYYIFLMASNMQIVT